MGVFQIAVKMRRLFDPLFQQVKDKITVYFGFSKYYHNLATIFFLKTKINNHENILLYFTLLYFTLLSLVMVFSACEKEVENNSHFNTLEAEMRACPTECFDGCTDFNYCCCRIIIEAFGQDDIIVCKPWDTTTDCWVEPIPNTDCDNRWAGIEQDLCLDTNRICAVYGLPFKISNTSAFDTIKATISCLSDRSDEQVYLILPREAGIFNLTGPGGCEHEICGFISIF